MIQDLVQLFPLITKDKKLRPTFHSHNLVVTSSYHCIEGTNQTKDKEEMSGNVMKNKEYIKDQWLREYFPCH